MNTIRHVFYVDAYYSYEDDIRMVEHYDNGKSLRRPKEKTSMLSTYDAFGYTKRHGDNIIVAFIKRKDMSISETIRRQEPIILGMVIPAAALLSKASHPNHDILAKVKKGARVAVTWRDVVFVENLPRYDCSIMYTEGTIYKINEDHIVLKDTETIRTHPMPAMNHPSGKPLWYIIPISFIKDVEVIQK